MAEKKSRFRNKAGSAKDAMQRRTEESQKRAGGTNKWNDYLVDDFDGDKFVATEGDHLIDIIPYLTGENDPRFGADERSYMLDVYTHQKVGTTEDALLCPSSNYRGLKCPICEHQAKMKQSKMFTDDEIKALNPKRRCLYNVVCYDTIETERKGVQVWEASYHLTENEILAIARNRRSGGYIPFADPDEGKTISFFREGKGSSTRYKGYQFVEREIPISDEILEDAYCLDALLDRKSYDEILEMFMTNAPEIPEEGGHRRAATDENEEEEEEQDRSRKPRGRIASRKPEPESEPEEEEEKPVRKSRTARKSAPEPEEEPPFDKDDDIPDYPQDEEEEPEEEPASRISRRRRRRS